MFNFRPRPVPYKYSPCGDGQWEVSAEGRTEDTPPRPLHRDCSPAVSTGLPQLMRLDVLSTRVDGTLSCSPLLLTPALIYVQISLFFFRFLLDFYNTNEVFFPLRSREFGCHESFLQNLHRQ